MSLITTTNIARDQIAYTEDVVKHQLRAGMASVVEPLGNGRFLTWCVAPNDPATGMGFSIRDRVRRVLEGERDGEA